MGPASIAVATDFSEASRPALWRAARLMGRSGGAVALLHVVEREAAGGDRRARELGAEDRNAVELQLAAAREELERAGARVRERRLSGVPHLAIVEAARDAAAELLLCGSHGRTGLRRMILGSVAEQVARQSAIPVLIARGRAERDFERVLIATDLDEPGERAAAAACRLAAAGAALDVVHFVSVASLASLPGRIQVTNDLPRLVAEAQRRGELLIERLGTTRVTPRFTVEIGEPLGGILQRIAERHHDLVAVGSHGRGGIARLALGSVSEGVTRQAGCSVLVVR
jgi:nucleotide-binding universal stress UspA family protein